MASDDKPAFEIHWQQRDVSGLGPMPIRVLKIYADGRLEGDWPHQSTVIINRIPALLAEAAASTQAVPS